MNTKTLIFSTLLLFVLVGCSKEIEEEIEISAKNKETNDVSSTYFYDQEYDNDSKPQRRTVVIPQSSQKIKTKPVQIVPKGRSLQNEQQNQFDFMTSQQQGATAVAASNQTSPENSDIDSSMEPDDGFAELDKNFDVEEVEPQTAWSEEQGAQFTGSVFTEGKKDPVEVEQVALTKSDVPKPEQNTVDEGSWQDSIYNDGDIKNNPPANAE